MTGFKKFIAPALQLIALPCVSWWKDMKTVHVIRQSKLLLVWIVLLSFFSTFLSGVVFSKTERSTRVFKSPVTALFENAKVTPPTFEGTASTVVVGLQLLFVILFTNIFVSFSLRKEFFISRYERNSFYHLTTINAP
jgi:hypothetical protein